MPMLLEYRKRQKISREALAKKVGVDARTIYRIEKDISIPLVDTYAKMVVALNMNAEEILNNLKKISEK